MLRRNQSRREFDAQIGTQAMGQIVGEGLVQPGEGLHLFLTNAAGQAAVPRGDGCGLNQHGHVWDTRTGGANHAVDFVLAQNLFHGSSRL